MHPVLPVLANGSTYITIKASTVIAMAGTAIAGIESKREEAVRKLLKHCMQQECVHRIPVLGIPFYRHKRYPNTKLAMRYAPEIQQAKNMGWGDLEICKNLKQMAHWLIENTDANAPPPVMHLSLNDFISLS